MQCDSYLNAMLVAAANEAQGHFRDVALIVALVQLLFYGVSHHQSDHCQL